MGPFTCLRSHFVPTPPHSCIELANPPAVMAESASVLDDGDELPDDLEDGADFLDPATLDDGGGFSFDEEEQAGEVSDNGGSARKSKKGRPKGKGKVAPKSADSAKRANIMDESGKARKKAQAGKKWCPPCENGNP